MLVAIAAMAFVAAIIVINGDDDDEVIPDEQQIEDGATSLWGDASEAATEGDDVLIGSGDNDTFFAENGSDTVEGHDGDDRLFGNGGSDLLIGGEGDDFVRGGLGEDIMVGEAGNDNLIGDAGGDLILGGDGNDTIDGGTGYDILIGNSGADNLSGGDGNDHLFGGDAVTENLTNQDLALALSEVQDGIPVTLWDDRFLSRQDDGAADTLDGGAGQDKLYVNDGDTATGGEDGDLFYLLDGHSDETAFITDFTYGEDALFYVYDEGTVPPALTLVDNNDGTQTLLADGTAVSVIVSTGLTVADINLFERFVPPS